MAFDVHDNEFGYPDSVVGHKADEDKLRYDLIPPEAMEALATVLTYGAKKYGDRNWEKGISADRLWAAAQRHLWTWWYDFDMSSGGDSLDTESELSHLSHALACIVFLITLKARGKL